MKVRQREIAGRGDGGRIRDGSKRRRETGREEQERRSREGVQERCHLSAADVIPKISSNNSRR